MSISKYPDTPTPIVQLNLNLHAADDHLPLEHDLGLNNNANGNAQSLPTLWGMPLKYISLVTLAVQNSMLTIIMHHSRVSTPPSRAYSAATAVLLNEVLKGLISLVIAFARIDIPTTPAPSPIDAQRGHCLSPASRSIYRLRKLYRDVFSADCWKLSIPAILYVIQNNLQYVAASNLEAATFQVSYQMKILTTAGFSVLLLRKKLSSSQWLALLFLAIGVGVVQIQAGGADKAFTSATTADLHDVHRMSAMKGFMAVSAACFTSGLAGVYFEMVLKNSQADLWVRNVQLSLFSLLPALAPILFSHASSPLSLDGQDWFASLFRNFGFWAWATVLIQVFGGLVTAMVIKYSDNILKGFATSLSIVISFLASVALFDFQMTFTFVLGSGIVLVATWLYNQPAKRVVAFNHVGIGEKESISWSLGWNLLPPGPINGGGVLGEKSKGLMGGASPLRSPAIGPTFPLTRMSSSSSVSSMVSLSASLIGASTPPPFDPTKERSKSPFWR